MCTSELCLIYFFKVSLQESFSQMLLTDPFPYCLPWAHCRQRVSVVSISTWVCKTCFRRVGQTDCLFLAPSDSGRKKATHCLEAPLAKCEVGPVLAGQVLPGCPGGSVHSMCSSPAPPPGFSPEFFPSGCADCRRDTTCALLAGWMVGGWATPPPSPPQTAAPDTSASWTTEEESTWAKPGMLSATERKVRGAFASSLCENESSSPDFGSFHQPQ